jgi:hypothetical protein
MKKEHFIHFFPFLNKKYRDIELAEITSEATFKELFPGEEIDYSKLNAVYHYQNLEPKTIVGTLMNPIIVFTDKPKRKRNAKI